MATIEQVVILVPADELLSSIWYSDALGTPGSVDMNCSPNKFKIHNIGLADDMAFVKIVLVPRERV